MGYVIRNGALAWETGSPADAPPEAVKATPATPKPVKKGAGKSP